MIPTANKVQFMDWLFQYKQRLLFELQSDSQRKEMMQSTNPKFILRNWIAQVAISKAEQGDYSEINKLMTLFHDPFAKLPQTNSPEFEKYATFPPAWADGLRCSCSS